MKIYLIERKFVLIEWKYILISWKKGDIMKICFIKYKIILIEWKYIFIFYEILFLQHFSNYTQNHKSFLSLFLKDILIKHIIPPGEFKTFNTDISADADTATEVSKTTLDVYKWVHK